MQFDVEPYVLRRWDREQEQVVEEWSANTEVWVQEAKRQGLPFSAAVPFWRFDTRTEPSGYRFVQPLDDPTYGCDCRYGIPRQRGADV